MKDVKVLPCEACTTRHKSLLCDSKGRGEKTARMHTKTVQRVISRHILTNTEQILKKILLLKVIKNFLKEALLQATDRSCEWATDVAKHEKTWRRNDDVSNSVSEKQRLWKEWKQKINKENYLKIKRKAWKAVYQVVSLLECEISST